MSNREDDCPGPRGLGDRFRAFISDVFNNVLVRVLTLVITGIMVGMGWINAAIHYFIQLITQVIMSMPPLPAVI